MKTSQRPSQRTFRKDEAQDKASAVSENSGSTEIPVKKRPPPAKAADLEGKKKRRTATREDSSGKPSRPLSAYNFFFKEERLKWLDDHKRTKKDSDFEEKKDGPNTFVSMGLEMGRRWKSLSPKEREKFEKIAEEDMKRYRQEMEEWTARQVKETKMERESAKREIKQQVQEPPSINSIPSHVTEQPAEPSLNTLGEPSIRQVLQAQLQWQNGNLNGLTSSNPSDLGLQNSSLQQFLQMQSLAQSNLGNELGDPLIQQLIRGQLAGQQSQQSYQQRLGFNHPLLGGTNQDTSQLLALLQLQQEESRQRAELSFLLQQEELRNQQAFLDAYRTPNLQSHTDANQIGAALQALRGRPLDDRQASLQQLSGIGDNLTLRQQLYLLQQMQQGGR